MVRKAGWTEVPGPLERGPGPLKPYTALHVRPIEVPTLLRAPLPPAHRLHDGGDDRDAVPHRRRETWWWASRGFTVRPPEARKKPRVSSFLDANFERILELKPDLVLGFSDLQADIGRELCKRGVPVVPLQPALARGDPPDGARGGGAGGAGRGRREAGRELEANLARHAEAAEQLPRRPRIFFEEWHEPLISGIRWCSELVELVGGEDVCRETRSQQGAKGRIFEPGRGGPEGPRGRHRELVRPQGEAREDRRAARLGAGDGGGGRPALRGEELVHPPARARRR